MRQDRCSPYPHHSWFAHWIAIHPPQVFEVHERRHAAHHLLLTTCGDADIRWRSCTAEAAYHSVAGDIAFFPCDQHPHTLSITTVDGFTAYDLVIPDRDLRAVCAAEGVPPMHGFGAAPVFRDALMEACLLRLSSCAIGHQVSEDIGDEIAARHIVQRLHALIGGGIPAWEKDGSIFLPATMRNLIAHIDSHLGVPLSLETLADTVRLSPGHFARKFRRSAGVSLSRFINTRRIAASHHLLLQEERSLAAIALDLGFSSQSHFTRLFVSLTGLSPDQFRKLHRPTVG